MSTDPSGAFYQQGFRAFKAGVLLCDAPPELTREWEIGWMDALAAQVRALAGPAKSTR